MPPKSATGSLYGELMMELRRVGWTPDQAAQAANIAERIYRGRRDQLIVACSGMGWSTRRIAKLFDLSNVQIHRLLLRLAPHVTVRCSSIHPAGSGAATGTPAATANRTGKPGVSGDGAAEATLENSGSAGALSASRAA